MNDNDFIKPKVLRNRLNHAIDFGVSFTISLECELNSFACAHVNFTQMIKTISWNGELLLEEQQRQKNKRHTNTTVKIKCDSHICVIVKWIEKATK